MDPCQSRGVRLCIVTPISCQGPSKILHGLYPYSRPMETLGGALLSARTFWLLMDFCEGSVRPWVSALTLRTGRCSFLFSGDINVKKALVSFPGLAGPSHTLLGSCGLVWEPPIQAKRKWEGAPGSMARAVPAQMSFGNWLRTSRAHWSGQVWPARSPPS